LPTALKTGTEHFYQSLIQNKELSADDRDIPVSNGPILHEIPLPNLLAPADAAAALLYGLEGPA
jgi:hypothetical protein